MALMVKGEDGVWTLVLPGAGSISYFQVYYCKAGYGSEIYVIQLLESCSFTTPTFFFHFLNKSPISDGPTKDNMTD